MEIICCCTLVDNNSCIQGYFHTHAQSKHVQTKKDTQLPFTLLPDMQMWQYQTKRDIRHLKVLHPLVQEGNGTPVLCGALDVVQ